jgi:hypothetical protein
LIEEGGAEGGIPNTSSISPTEWIQVSLSSAQCKEHRDFWEEIVESCLPGNILDIFDDGNMQHSMKFMEEVDSSMTEELLEQMNFDIPPPPPAFDSPWKRGNSVVAESAERSVSPVLLFSTAESSILSKTASSSTTTTTSSSSSERRNGLKGLDNNDSRHHCIPESDTSSDEDGINVLENELLFDKSFLMSADISLFEPIPEEDLLEELMEPLDMLGTSIVK